MENTIIWAVRCTISYDWDDVQSQIVKVFSTKQKALDYIKLQEAELEKRIQNYTHYYENVENINEYIEPCLDEEYSMIELIVE